MKIETSKNTNNRKNKKSEKQLSNLQIVALGYFGVVCVGTILLMLPLSSHTGTTFTEAFFTAVSASCVTGLVVVDTATHYTFFGQCVVLLLIQLGGMGFMTIGVQFMVLMRKRIGLKEREIMLESINGLQVGGIVGLVQKIVLFTLTVELLGALALSLKFIPEFGVAQGIYYSIFHSISAFCNAGFDLMGVKEAYSSLVWYANDLWINLVMYALITLGGIGFLIWQDVHRHGLCFRKYTLHSKIVIAMSCVLSFGGGVLFFILEANTLHAGLSLQERILTALFHSISCRTAGFNTFDIGGLSTGGALVTMILMFIGGSPSSTAGGIKTTTVAVIFLHTVAVVQGKKRAGAFGRRLEPETLNKAVAIIAINFSFVIVGTIAICVAQPLPLTEVLIEVSSAMGTAGLSTGITRELVPVSRYFIAVIMFFGRVGSVSIAGALMEKRAKPAVELPKERIIVG